MRNERLITALKAHPKILNLVDGPLENSSWLRLSSQNDSTTLFAVSPDQADLNEEFEQNSKRFILPGYKLPELQECRSLLCPDVSPEEIRRRFLQ